MDKDRRKELDQFVINIEFLLISVVQGLALSALATAAVAPIVNLQFEYWPYIVSGLLFILIFWSEAVVHVLSFIRFPMDMGHNFLYFVAGLVEVVAFSQVTNPLGWFALFFIFVAVSGILYWKDLALIKACEKDFVQTAAGRALYEHIYSEQLYELKTFVPAGLIFNLVVIALLLLFSTQFVDHKYHLILITLQVIFAAGILVNSIKNFKRRQALIAKV